MSHLIDPLHFCIALLPLSLYLFGVGVINLSKRPRVVSGTADSFLLGLGLAGFVVAGPGQLFLPSATVFRLGGWVWPLLLLAYLLGLTLLVLMSRPRIVIYNIASEQLRSALAAVLAELDPEARWAGDSASLPRLGIQMHLESTTIIRHAQLTSTSSVQNFDSWRSLQRRLALRLATVTGNGAPYSSGAPLIAAAILLLTLGAVWAASDPGLIAQSFQQLMHPAE